MTRKVPAQLAPARDRQAAVVAVAAALAITGEAVGDVTGLHPLHLPTHHRVARLHLAPDPALILAATDAPPVVAVWTTADILVAIAVLHHAATGLTLAPVAAQPRGTGTPVMADITGLAPGPVQGLLAAGVGTGDP